jgi:hypothetical protein
MKRCHFRLHYDRKFQIFIFLIEYINVNKGVFCLCNTKAPSGSKFLLPGYESDSVITECVWLGRINNQTGGPSKTGKCRKGWMEKIRRLAVVKGSMHTHQNLRWTPIGQICRKIVALKTFDMCNQLAFSRNF